MKEKLTLNPLIEIFSKEELELLKNLFPEQYNFLLNSANLNKKNLNYFLKILEEKINSFLDQLLILDDSSNQLPLSELAPADVKERVEKEKVFLNEKINSIKFLKETLTSLYKKLKNYLEKNNLFENEK